MPHPFYRGLLAYLVGVFATPPLVDALIVGSRRRVLQWLIVMLIPYLTTKLVRHCSMHCSMPSRPSRSPASASLT